MMQSVKKNKFMYFIDFYIIKIINLNFLYIESLSFRLYICTSESSNVFCIAQNTIL